MVTSVARCELHLSIHRTLHGPTEEAPPQNGLTCRCVGGNSNQTRKRSSDGQNANGSHRVAARPRCARRRYRGRGRNRLLNGVKVCVTYREPFPSSSLFRKFLDMLTVAGRMKPIVSWSLATTQRSFWHVGLAGVQSLSFLHSMQRAS